MPSFTSRSARNLNLESILVVIVFYAAIILILVGTNLRRFKTRRSKRKHEPPRKDMIVHSTAGQHRIQSVQTTVVTKARESKEEYLNPSRSPDLSVV